jgi:hypothetical protein
MSSSEAIADDVTRAGAERRSDRLARLRKGAVGRVLGYNELGVAVAG